MLPERYAHQRDEWAIDTPAHAPAALAAHLGRGGGVLAMHTACICFDDWPGWGDTLGGAWDWERSSHPPAGVVDVQVHADAHPIVAGLHDFDVHDEVYGFLRHPRPVVPLVTGAHGGAVHPLVWTAEHGTARVVVDTLGHSERSYAVDQHREIVRRAARWAAGEELA
jgi:type 1 glutamine amidotransferase